MKDNHIDELPFQEILRDTDILHIHSDGYKKTTMARVWDWFVGKLKSTSKAEGGVIVDKGQGNLAVVNPEFLYQSTSLFGLYNALMPINFDVFEKKGFHRIDIWAYEIARKSPFYPLGGFLDIYIDCDIFEVFIRNKNIQDYLLEYGWAFCNGKSGSLDLRACVRRTENAGSNRAQDLNLGTYESDAMQLWESDLCDVMSGIRYEGAKRKKGFKAYECAPLNVPQGEGPKFYVYYTLSNKEAGLRTSYENRMKNVRVATFQKVKDSDFRSIKDEPQKLFSK